MTAPPPPGPPAVGWPVRLGLAAALGWFAGGAAYGLLVAGRLGICTRPLEPLLVMAYTGLAFGLLGAVLWGLRAGVRLLLRGLGRPVAPIGWRALPAAGLAGLGGFGLAFALLFVLGDLVVALGFQPHSSRVWLALRAAGGLALGAGWCWLAGRAARRLDRRPARRTLGLAGLAAAGWLLAGLGLGLLGAQPDRPGPRAGPPAGAKPRATGLRVLLIGLDGATWSVLEPLAEAGEMPVLAGLIRRGARATPLSPPPRASPVTWTTIVTGRRPEDHGVRDYLLVAMPGLEPFPFESLAHDRSLLPFSFAVLGFFGAGLAEGIPPTSDRVRSPALWHILAAGGQCALVLGMPCTWPAEPLAGLVVSDRWVPHELDMFSRRRDRLPRRLHPPEAEARLEPLRVDSGGDPAPMLRALAGFDEARSAELAAWRYNPLIAAPARLLAEVWDADLTLLNVLDAEWPRSECALGVALINGLDMVMHAFWAHRFPADFGRSESPRPEWGRLIDAYHALVDQRLGALLEASGPQTVVLLVSDSGMQASPGNLVWPGWHAEAAMFLAAGGPIRPGLELERVDYLDLAPTVLALLGFPVAADMPGRVLEEMIEPDFWARHPIRRIDSWE